MGSQRQRDVTYQSAMRFCEQNPKSVLELLDEEEIQERKQQRRKEQQLAKVCRGDKELARRVTDFAQSAGLMQETKRMDLLLELLADVASTASGSAASSEPESVEPTVDANICCWSTGK